MLLALATACGTSSTQAKPSTTPDPLTQKYVALVKTYWIQIQAAEQASSTPNVTARVCYGTVSRWSAPDLNLIDPKKCRERMLACLAVHQRFLAALEATTPPTQFAADDQTFKAQLPKGIAHLNALIAATTSANKDAIRQDALTYAGDFFPLVMSALDDVDPSVVHN